ncbi:unnamed protein product [Closterium sp. NIES-65]|nr:unnamed protein product [Closterium sp. NIES-65]
MPAATSDSATDSPSPASLSPFLSPAHPSPHATSPPSHGSPSPIKAKLSSKNASKPSAKPDSAKPSAQPSAQPSAKASAGSPRERARASSSLHRKLSRTSSGGGGADVGDGGGSAVGVGGTTGGGGTGTGGSGESGDGSAGDGGSPDLCFANSTGGYRNSGSIQPNSGGNRNSGSGVADAPMTSHKAEKVEKADKTDKSDRPKSSSGKSGDLDKSTKSDKSTKADRPQESGESARGDKSRALLRAASQGREIDRARLGCSSPEAKLGGRSHTEGREETKERMMRERKKGRGGSIGGGADLGGFGPEAKLGRRSHTEGREGMGERVKGRMRERRGSVSDVDGLGGFGGEASLGGRSQTEGRDENFERAKERRREKEREREKGGVQGVGSPGHPKQKHRPPMSSAHTHEHVPPHEHELQTHQQQQSGHQQAEVKSGDQEQEEGQDAPPSNAPSSDAPCKDWSRSISLAHTLSNPHSNPAPSHASASHSAEAAASAADAADGDDDGDGADSGFTCFDPSFDGMLASHAADSSSFGDRSDLASEPLSSFRLGPADPDLASPRFGPVKKKERFSGAGQQVRQDDSELGSSESLSMQRQQEEEEKLVRGSMGEGPGREGVRAVGGGAGGDAGVQGKGGEADRNRSPLRRFLGALSLDISAADVPVVAAAPAAFGGLYASGFPAASALPTSIVSKAEGRKQAILGEGSGGGGGGKKGGTWKPRLPDVKEVEQPNKTLAGSLSFHADRRRALSDQLSLWIK